MDPERSLGLAVADDSGLWSPQRLREARIDPPPNSRANARSRLMREIMGKEGAYFLDWEGVEIPNQKRTRLLDPFEP